MIFAVTTASGSFLLFIRFRTLHSGFFCLQWLSCTLGFFCLWVFPALYGFLYPPLWVFLSSIAGLYPRLPLPLGSSCALYASAPSSLGFSDFNGWLVPSASSASGSFLLLMHSCTLLSGSFFLQWLACTPSFLCLWVLPAPYALLHPPLWVFLLSMAILYPRPPLALGLSCSLRLPVPLHDDSSLCIYRYCDCPVVLGAKP